jgi:hypothetical protein
MMKWKIAFVATLFWSAAGNAQSWQAVAASPSTSATGYSFEQSSQASAEREAVAACATEGATDCVALGASRGCELLVQDAGRLIASSEPLAQRRKARAANSGEVVTDVCQEVAKASSIIAEASLNRDPAARR